MANEADGSIVIDTELDNDGFEKGSEKLLKAVQDLAGAVDNLGDNMMSSFSKVIPLLQNIAGSASSVNDALGNSATQAAEAGDRVSQAEQQVAQAAQQASQAVSQQGQSMTGLVSGAASAQQSASGLEKEIASLSNGMAGLSRSAETGFTNANAVLSFDNKLTDMESKVDTAREKLEAFGQVQIPTEDYTWLQNAIQNVEKEYDRLIERQDKMSATGVKENSKEWQALEYQISLNRQKMAEYKSDLESLESSGGAFTLGSDTAEYNQMAAQLAQITADLERNKALIDQEALAQARLNVQTAQEAVLTASNANERAAAMEQLRTAQQELSNLAGSMSNQSGPAESDVSGWQRFGAVLKTVGSAAVKTAASLAKLSFKAIGKGVQAACSKLKQFVAQSKKTTLSTKGLVKSLTSLKTMLLSRVKRMFISAIFSDVKESMQTLAQFSSEFNTAMSNIKNSCKELGANLSVSLGSLITAIEPILTKIISMISTAMSYLSAFFAMLSGKSTVTVAKKQTDSYADSLGSAAGAAEDLKNQVYGFDELNKRSSSDSGSGGSGSSAGDLFEEMAIDDLLPDEVQSFFDKIKAAIAAGDWYGVGYTIGEGLNYLLQVTDDWINGTLRPKGVEWAANIAEVFNGLTDGIDWALLGKTIGDAINAIADIYTTFMTTYDFENLGEKVATGINGLFDSVEWDLLGETFAVKWQALIEFVYGLVHNLDWGSMGTDIGTAIQSWFDTIDWTMLADSVVTGFNGIVTMLANAIETIDWYGMMTDLVDGATTLITGIDWAELGRLLSDGVIALLDLIIALVGETDWGGLIQNVLTGIGTLIENIDWGEILTKLGAAILELVVQIPSILMGALSGISNIIGSLFEAVGLDGIAGFFKGIGDAMANVGTWLKENLVDPVINWVKDLFGIHSPSTVFAEFGDDLIQGLFNGISEKWTIIKDFFTGALDNLKTSLSNAWSNIKSTASTAWSNVKTTVTTAFNNTKTAVVTAAGNIKTNLSTAWSNVKSTATSSWNSVKTSVTTAFNSAKSTVTTAASNMKSSLTSSWSSLQSTASSTWNSIKSTASTAWESIKSAATTKWATIKSTITEKWTSLKDTMRQTEWSSLGSNLISGIKQGISNAWSTLKTFWTNKISSLLSTAKSVLGIASPSKEMAKIGEYTDEGLQQGMEKGENGIFSTVKDIATGIVNGMDVDIPEIGTEADGMISGLDVAATRLSEIANVFRSITDSLTSLGGLKTPQIATGTVVPVKTKIDTTTTDNALTGDFTAFSDGVDERMADQTYVLRQILSAIGGLNLNIDLDALSRSITKQQRERSLNFGGAV